MSGGSAMNDLWSLGNSSSLEAEFNPDSLGAGFFDMAGGGSLGSFQMDLGEDEAEPMAADSKEEPFAVNAEGGASFPERPGPVVPREAWQPFRDPLTPAMCVSEATHALLSKVHHFQQEQRVNLERLRLVQLQILSQPSAPALKALEEQERSMCNDTGAAMQALVHIWCGTVLSPLENARWQYLWQDLQLQREQLEVYRRELHKDTSQPWASLVVVSHSLPLVATRGRPLEEPTMTVQLVTGATVSVVQTSQVSAVPVIPSSTKGKMAPDLLEDDTAPLQGDACVASFPQLCFANGTRKQPIHFRFRVMALLRSQAHNVQHEIVSQVTPPTIAVTNEVQWEEAEGLLLERMAFVQGDQSPCTWHSIENHLQRHLVSASRQSVSTLRRIFSRAELDYFHAHFFSGAATIMAANVREWWRWYGKCIHKIRYTKHCLALWLNGLLFGFIGKAQLEHALRGHPLGTFMLRFSESNPGAISIGYVAADAVGAPLIRHYLVAPEDLSQRKSLPDFLMEGAALQQVLCYQVRSGFNLAADAPPLQFERQNKAEALREFVARRETPSSTPGYDSELANAPSAFAAQPRPNPLSATDHDCWDAE